MSIDPSLEAQLKGPIDTLADHLREEVARQTAAVHKDLAALVQDAVQKEIERTLATARAEAWENGREQGRFEARQDAEAARLQSPPPAAPTALQAAPGRTTAVPGNDDDLTAIWAFAPETSAAPVAPIQHEESAAIHARLLIGVRAIDRAGSLSEVLDTLVQCGTREAPRSAVFIVRGHSLRPWKLSGFPERPANEPIADIMTAQAGVAGEAVRGRATAVGEIGPDFARLPKGGTAVGVPIVLANEPVAVLYADDGAGEGEVDGEDGHAPGGGTLRSTGALLLELLGRHAAMTLEALVAMSAARALAEGQ